MGEPAQQLSLMDELRPPEVPTRASQLDEEAREFLRSNPTFWRLFSRYVRELIDAGVTRYSADAVVHRIRWHTTVRGGSPYKANNNYVACFARIWNATYPEHAIFETRERRSEQARAKR